MGQSASSLVMTPAEAAAMRKRVSLEPHEVRERRLAAEFAASLRKPLDVNWRDQIAVTARDLAFEFNGAMSEEPPPDFGYVEHSNGSQSWGPSYEDGRFQVDVMSPQACNDFANALKRAQWPVDRVAVEQWGCAGVQPYSCRIYWKKKTADPKLPDQL
jgi:hypothetical protein